MHVPVYRVKDLNSVQAWVQFSGFLLKKKKLLKTAMILFFKIQTEGIELNYMQ